MQGLKLSQMSLARARDKQDKPGNLSQMSLTRAAFKVKKGFFPLYGIFLCLFLPRAREGHLRQFRRDAA